MQTLQPVSTKRIACAPRRETILVVDEEKIVRDVACAILTKSGYDVIQAESGEAALEIARNNPRRISLVVLDPDVPGAIAKRSFTELLAMRPELALVLCSGYPPSDTVQSFGVGRIRDFVPKPYTSSRLRSAVESALMPHAFAA
jgi:two-component system, cell cycle sensor histidine kinase and response regulator CckA